MAKRGEDGKRGRLQRISEIGWTMKSRVGNTGRENGVSKAAEAGSSKRAEEMMGGDMKRYVSEQSVKSARNLARMEDCV